MRLIDADALLSEYDEVEVLLYKGDKVMEYVSQEQIDNAPTIETEPVRRGRWLKRDVHRVRNKNQPVFILQCSECGMYTTIKSTYCPTCGARMR